MSAGHTVYSPEFKAAALDLVRRIGRKPAARQLGVAVNTLHRWEKPDLYARQLLGSADAKWRRKELCVRGCGRLTSYDSTSGVCIDCTIAENRAAHGTASRYSSGCRCEDCRRANTDRMREYVARRRGSPVTPRPRPRTQPTVHGETPFFKAGWTAHELGYARTEHDRLIRPDSIAEWQRGWDACHKSAVAEAVAS